MHLVLRLRAINDHDKDVWVILVDRQALRVAFIRRHIAQVVGLEKIWSVRLIEEPRYMVQAERRRNQHCGTGEDDEVRIAPAQATHPRAVEIDKDLILEKTILALQKNPFIVILL